MPKPRERAKELLDGIRVRPAGIRGNHRIQKLHEPPGGAHREVVDRMTDDVGVDMLGKVKADRKTARARTLRVVVGNARNSRKVRETDRHRSGIPLQMRRPRQRGGFQRRRERASQQDAFGVRRSETGVDTAISFVERFDDFPAQDQEFFIRRQGHGSALRPMILPFTTEATLAEMNTMVERRAGVTRHALTESWRVALRGWARNTKTSVIPERGRSPRVRNP